MQLLLVWYIPTLTLIDHCNISLSTIKPMLQHTGMEVFDQSKSVVPYQILGTLEIPECPISNIS